MKVTKIVIPAAGLGTRFLPYTKAIPKEMLPVLNKPLVQYSIEEGLASEINNFILVTDKDKSAIANHIDADHPHANTLAERNIKNLLDSTERIGRLGNYTYVRQREPLGLGHAVWLAQQCINPKEYFGIMLPDEMIDSKEPALKQLLRIAYQEKASVIAVQEVPQQLVSLHDIIAVKKTITPSLFQVSHIVEKPSLKDAPSHLAIVGRYVVSSKIFGAIDYVSNSAEGTEIQLNKAVSSLMQSNERVFAYKVQGTHYTIDTPMAWLKANIGYALKNPEYAAQIRAMVQDGHALPDMPFFNPAKMMERGL